MKHTLITLTLLALSMVTGLAAAPVNDSVTKAVVLQGPYQVLTTPDVSTATSATTDPLINGASAGKTLWYRVRRSDAEKVFLDVKPLTGSLVVGLYTASDPENPLSSLQSGFPAPLTTTRSYTFAPIADLYLMIAGTGTCEIAFQLAVKNNQSNDFISQATTLSGIKGTVQGENWNCTVTADEPAFPIAMFNTIWYKWTPGVTTAAYVDTSFSFLGGDVGDTSNSQPVHDTVLAVYVGSPSSLTQVASDDNSGWNVNARVKFNAVAGSTYYIVVGSQQGNASGKFQLHYFTSSSSAEYQFAPNTDRTFDENIGATIIQVRRLYAPDITSTVLLSTTAGGTATAGSDYTAITNLMLSFPLPSVGDGSWAQNALPTLINDTAEESTESFNFQLSSPSSGSVLGADSTATLSIADNDSESGDGGAFVLEKDEIRLKEGATAYNALLRLNASGESVFVAQSAFIAGDPRDATPNVDFTVSNTQMGSSENRAQLPFDTVNDDVFEGDESVIIILSTGQFYEVVIEDDDPYIAIAGKLVAGLDYSSRRAQLFATISGTGAVTGKLSILGQSLSWKAQLNDRGKATVPLMPKGRAGGLVLTVQATDANGGFRVTLHDGLTQTSSYAEVVMQNYAATVNPCPQAGRYTLVGNGINGVSVAANCAASIVVDVAGNAVFSGKVFDGTPFTMAGYVDGAGQVFGMASLYGNLGLLSWSGELPATSNQVVSLTGRILRPARAGDATKLQVVTGNAGMGSFCCRYTPPTAGQRALDCWSAGTGKATLSGGPLMNMLTKALTISTSNIVMAPVDAEKLKVTLVPSTGLFSGSFVLPSSNPAKTLTIYGALIDLPATNGYGQGFFFDGLKGGKIVIGQP